MLKNYPTHTFTPEEPELAINFNTGMKLSIVKFIMLSEGQDFLSNHLLEFQVQMGNTIHPVKSFVSCISPSQKDIQVAEVNMAFQSEEKGIAKVKIMDQGNHNDYSITMVYDIQPLDG